MEITIFTPAYNRGYIIESLYKSLKNQTFTNFEWIVIDDGSLDNTEQLFKVWLQEKNPFEIIYIKSKNGGKHRAINKATDLARGELFFIVDSDDYLVDYALETIVKWEKSISNKEQYCGLAGNRGTSEGKMIGTTFEGEYIDATSIERNKKNITGDKAEIFYTEILKQYKFDEIDGENFITEATVWDRMANDGYKIRWFNKTIYICNYLEDGLTQNIEKVFSQNPKGAAIYINQQIKFYKYNLKGKLANYHLYYKFVKRNVGIKEAAKYLDVRLPIFIGAIFLFGTKNFLIKNK